MHKKRRISQANPKDPSAIRVSPPAGFRSSDNQSDAAKGDEPKTSEYAFFKKLKTDAGQRNKFNSRPLTKEEIQPNKFKSSDFLRESSSSPIKNSSKDFRLPGEDIIHVHPRVLLTSVERSSSPMKNSSKEFRLPVEDITRVNRCALLTPVEVDLKRASAPFEDIWSIRNSMEESRTLRPAGTQNKYEDLFTAKRKKLHQWVADISFTEIKELCSKGYDLVSLLLGRLFPESEEENSFEIATSKQVESVSKSNLLASPCSNIYLKNPHDMSARNFMEIESGSYSEYGLSSCWLDNLSKRTLSSSDSPTCHSQNTLLEYNLREPSSGLGVKSKISWIESDCAFSFPSKNYGHLPSCHLRDLDDFHDPDDSLLRREQQPLLLGWKLENERNQRTCLSSLTRDLISYPISLTSWGGNHEQSLDEFGPLGASKLCTSSVVCKYSPNLRSLPTSYSTSYYEDEYGRHFLAGKDDTGTDLKHYPLALSTLPRMPSYPSLTEDCNYDCTFRGSRSLPSPGNHHSFMSEARSEQHYDSGPEVLLSSKLDFDLGRKCLSRSESSNKNYSFIHPALQSPPKEGIFTHFLARDEFENNLDGLSSRGILSHYSREMANIHDWSSFYFQISLDKEKSCPLLLEKSSWEGSEEEIYNDGSDIEYL